MAKHEPRTPPEQGDDAQEEQVLPRELVVDPEVTIVADDGLSVREDPLAAELAVHTSESPILSGGDIDADWRHGGAGEEQVGGSAPTPDQDVASELAEAVGVPVQDEEALRGFEEKVAERDDRRWELDPASSEDYEERARALQQKPKPASR
jgi:hypothetical protein